MPSVPLCAMLIATLWYLFIPRLSYSEAIPALPEFSTTPLAEFLARVNLTFKGNRAWLVGEACDLERAHYCRALPAAREARAL